jgi:hypothetical protein
LTRSLPNFVPGGSMRLATKAAIKSDTANPVNDSGLSSYRGNEGPSCLCTGSGDNRVACAEEISTGTIRSEVKRSGIGVESVRTGRVPSTQRE